MDKYFTWYSYHWEIPNGWPNGWCLLGIWINHISKTFQYSMSISHTVHMVFSRPILIFKKFTEKISIFLRAIQKRCKDIGNFRGPWNEKEPTRNPSVRKEQKSSNINISSVKHIFIKDRSEISIPKWLNVAREPNAMGRQPGFHLYSASFRQGLYPVRTTVHRTLFEWAPGTQWGHCKLIVIDQLTFIYYLDVRTFHLHQWRRLYVWVTGRCTSPTLFHSASFQTNRAVSGPGSLALMPPVAAIKWSWR